MASLSEKGCVHSKMLNLYIYTPENLTQQCSEKSLFTLHGFELTTWIHCSSKCLALSLQT